MPDDAARTTDIPDIALTINPPPRPVDPALARAVARAATETPSRETLLEPSELRDAVGEALIAARVDRLPDGHLLGQTVWFRSRTGRWTAPAIVTATYDSLHQPNVDAGHLRPLSAADDPRAAHVHLTVLTPGIQGHVSDETRTSNPELVADDRPNKPAGGTFQEWDVPQWVPAPEDLADSAGAPTFAFDVQPPGTWMFPL